MQRIAILIPCYNEAQTIAKVVRDYRAVLPEADIYVYDNNSTDHTDEIARAAGAIVRYERRQGKGNVIRTMFREIDADCYLMIDGDDTYPAEAARRSCCSSSRSPSSCSAPISASRRKRRCCRCSFPRAMTPIQRIGAWRKSRVRLGGGKNT